MYMYPVYNRYTINMITPIMTGFYHNDSNVTCQTGEENFWRSYAAIFPLWEVLHKNKVPQQERSKVTGAAGY